MSSVKLFLRAFFPLLLGLLASCTVYDSIFHPRRLPTPPMTAEAKAKYRASEKARHKGTVLKTEEITTSATDPAAAGSAKDATDKKLTYNELPEGTKLKYDKQLLLKKPKLKRRRYHTYETKPLKPNKVSRENRRLRKHPKGQGSEHPRDQPLRDQPTSRPPDEGLGTSTAPEPTPPAAPTKAKEPKVKEPKVKEPKAPKEKKSKKVPIPKPDPTLERPGY